MQNQVSVQEQALAELHQHVDTLGSDLEEQQQKQAELTNTVEHQKVLLHTAIAEYDERLQQQEEQYDKLEGTMQVLVLLIAVFVRELPHFIVEIWVLFADEGTMQALLRVRFRIDLVVDLVCVLLGRWVAQTGATTWLLSWVSAAAVRSPNASAGSKRSIVDVTRLKRQRSSVLRLLQLLVFGVVAKRLRTLCVDNGLHSNVGTLAGYSEAVTDTANKSFSSLLGKGSSSSGNGIDLSSLSSFSITGALKSVVHTLAGAT